VRIPAFEHLWAGARGPLVPALRASVNALASLRRVRGLPHVQAVDSVRGFAFSGHVDALRLKRMLAAAGEGVTEIGVHPGVRHPGLAQRYAHWGGYEWAGELAALTDPEVVAICAGAVTLTSFSRLAAVES
jgi:hypothetical protein